MQLGLKLQQAMRRWKSRTLPRRTHSSSTPGSIRPGFIAVYVGNDRQRFVIPTRYVNYPVFASLLEQAEEELGGFMPAGGLVLTCDSIFFGYVIDALDRDENRYKAMKLQGFIYLFYDSAPNEDSYYYSCVHESSVAAAAAFSPLLPKARA